MKEMKELKNKYIKNISSKIEEVQKMARTNLITMENIEDAKKKIISYFENILKKYQNDIYITYDFNFGIKAKAYGYSYPQTTQVVFVLKKGKLKIDAIIRADQCSHKYNILIKNIEARKHISNKLIDSFESFDLKI